MDSILVRASLAFAAACLLTLPASAHGGAYLPTGWGMPIPSTPGSPSSTGGVSFPGPMTGGTPGPGPTTGGDPASGLVSWRDWWHFNQDAFLDLRRSIQRAAVETGGDGFGPQLRSLLNARLDEEQVRAKLAPALLKLLADESSNEIATAALVALARSGDAQPAQAKDSLVPALRARLTDSSQEVAESAALALGILGDESGLDLLASLLQDDEEARKLLGGGRSVSTRTRSFAAYSLGLLAEQAHNNRTRQRAARGLCAALGARREPPQDVQVACVIALSLDRLDPERGQTQSAEWVSRQSLVHALLESLDAPHRRATVRAHIVTALARLVLDAGGTLRTEVERALLDELRRGRALENEVSQSCVQALGLLADADADPLDVEMRAVLLRALDTTDQATRFFALIALGEAGGHPGSGERSDEGRAQCRNALLNELVRGRSRMRPWAAIALGVQEFRVRGAGGEPSSQVRKELRDWLRAEGSPEEVGAGSIALGLAHDVEAAQLLRAKLGKSSPTDSQGYVALALGMTGTTDALPELRAITLAARYRPWVLEPAATALALLGDRDIESQLLDALRSTQSLSTQSALARAIGQIGDARVFDPMLALAQDRGLPGSTRAFATIALGMLGERGDLPWYVPLARDRNYIAVTPTLMGGDGQGVLEIF
ncbi:MAG: HEAT repeat domain-containing protein [Planctomycetes bacterium]|nr:HEAT repeat domain-containing protein [Planctomycetota bacterium]